MPGGIEQGRAPRYLAVNVYPGSDRWRVAVLVREPGRPYPRLSHTVGTYDLPLEVNDLTSALEAAAEVLQRLSTEVRHSAPA